jgi:ribonuclease-3
MIFSADEIEKKIKYVFKDKMLLRKCFTHSSYANENGGENNELLEFFGDAIIQFVVTEFLYSYAKGDEGRLTVKRSRMVSKEPLLKSAKELGLFEHLLLGKGQAKNHNYNEKLYSSVYEALVAGIYLDGGITAVKRFIKRTIIEDYVEDNLGKIQEIKADSKSEAQEYVQKKKLGSITYELLGKKGPDHSPEFRVAALLNGKKLSEGKGGSKKAAEAKAAEVALKKVISDNKKKWL